MSALEFLVPHLFYLIYNDLTKGWNTKGRDKIKLFMRQGGLMTAEGRKSKNFKESKTLFRKEVNSKRRVKGKKCGVSGDKWRAMLYSSVTTS